MNYPPLAESGVHLNFNEYYLHKPGLDAELVVRKKMNNNIAILKLFPGITPNVVESVLATKGLKGVVLETYGSGNALNQKWFLELLKNAIYKKIKIINVTQCVAGAVSQGHYETSIVLKELGVISGRDITTESAIAKLMYLLSENLSDEEFTGYFEKPLRGELTS